MKCCALDEKELSEAIVQPAEGVGVYVEAALVERIVADAGSEPGILPFVQETMRLLWTKVERRYLPVQAYETLVLPRSAYDGRRMEEVTGLQAAIAMHAEAVFTKLEEPQQAIARRIFIRLVHFGEGRSHTRRQQPVSRLRGGSDPALFEPVLTYLADEKNRLLILGGEEKGLECKVDIAHEALIGAWPRLLGWSEKQREAEEFRRGFAQDSDQWMGKQQDVFFLYEGTKLAEALSWEGEHAEELNSEEREFLKASTKRDRQRKLARVFVRSVIVLFALFGAFAIGYFARLACLSYLARGPMVYFPAGPARLGADLRTVELPAFFLDRFEITNRQYRLCMEAGVCLRPSKPQYYKGIDDAESDRLPVVWVNAYQAASFCNWIGRRLPTQAEWERAPRGFRVELGPGARRTHRQHGSTFSFRNSRTCCRVSRSLKMRVPKHRYQRESWASRSTTPSNCAFSGLVPVDDPRFAAGATPEGVMHLLGNAREWTSTPGSCSDPYACSPLWKGKDKILSLMTVGLSWGDDLVSTDSNRYIAGQGTQPIHFIDTIGFRCAK